MALGNAKGLSDKVVEKASKKVAEKVIKDGKDEFTKMSKWTNLEQLMH